MRKILLSIVLLFFILPFVISCSDDDDPTLDENLIGKWYKKPGNYLIDSIEFTSDFKYRESKYNSITETSSWSDWMDYQIKGKSEMLSNGKDILIEGKICYYIIEDKNGKKVMTSNIRDLSYGRLAIYTKVE